MVDDESSSGVVANGARQRCPQRLAYLRTRLASLNFRPQKRRGQNFLLDTNLCRYIARLGEPKPGDIILEVGCGSGLLTRYLSASGARVVAVEIDERLLTIAREEVGHGDVTFCQADILAGKHNLNPAAIAEIRAKLAGTESASTLKTVSNLPYAVATPFIANLLSSDLPWACGVFLVQYEVAERLTALPATRAYGPLAIYAALAGRARIVRRVPPEVFWPRPAVMSAVITIEFRPIAERLALPWPALRQIVSAAFSRRRKSLRNALHHIFAMPERVLAELSIDSDLRPEALAPEQFLVLARRLG